MIHLTFALTPAATPRRSASAPRGPWRARYHRRFDHHRRRRRLLDHHRRPVADRQSVLLAGPAQLHERPHQPARARGAGRHLRLLPGGAAHGARRRRTIFVPGLAISGGVIFALVASLPSSTSSTTSPWPSRPPDRRQRRRGDARSGRVTLSRGARRRGPADDATMPGRLPVGPWRRCWRAERLRPPRRRRPCWLRPARGVVARMEHAVGEFVIEGLPWSRSPAPSRWTTRPPSS